MTISQADLDSLLQRPGVSLADGPEQSPQPTPDTGIIPPLDTPAKQYRSNIEEWYGEVWLQGLLLAGDILRYEYEPIKFYLVQGRDGTSQRKVGYTPDYLVIKPDQIEFHELKACRMEDNKKVWDSERDDSRVKFAMAVKLFPEFVWRKVFIAGHRGTHRIAIVEEY